MEVQNIVDRKLGIGTTKNAVGVNGIDPARQGIKDRSIVLKNYSIEEWSIVVRTGKHRSIESRSNPWRTGRMPFAPTRLFVFDLSPRDLSFSIAIKTECNAGSLYA